MKETAVAYDSDLPLEATKLLFEFSDVVPEELPDELLCEIFSML